jgi:diacylglycerol kinase family enzyme
MTKHLLFGNPSAQSGRAKDAIVAARTMLAARGVDVVAMSTEPHGRTPALVTRAILEHAPDAVLALGGDGTFNEVARGILASGRDVHMGMIPMGTANDQGRSFGLKPGVDHVHEHIDVITQGHTTWLDVGHASRLDAGGTATDTAMFFDSASFGLAPDILAVRNRDREDVKNVPLLSLVYRDQAVYVGAAIDRLLASFVEPTRFDAVIETDRGERTFRGLTDLVVKATPIFAGAWVLDRTAEPDDGLFELVTVKSRGEWITRVVRDLAHNPLHPDVIFGVPVDDRLSASRFELRFFRPGNELVASQIDGEEWKRGDRFRIEVEARRLPLYTPAGFAPPWKSTV